MPFLNYNSEHFPFLLIFLNRNNYFIVKYYGLFFI